MPATDALLLKMIWREDLRGPLLPVMLEGFIKSVEGKAGPRTNNVWTDPGISNKGTFAPEETGESYAKRLHSWTDAAYAYYIDARMHALVTAAAESMPQEELLPSDLPTDQGFMLIPGGMGSIDIRGRLLKYNVVLWSAFGGKVEVVWLTDKNDMQDSMNMMLREEYSGAGQGLQHRNFPRLSPAHVSHMEFGKPLPMTPGPDFLVPPDVKIQVTEHETAEGTQYGWFVQDGGYDSKELAEKMQLGVRTDPALRWLLAAWRMMQQSVADVKQEGVPTNLRKQMKARNMPDKKVTVIRLRHAKPRGKGETEVEWTHQWLVRGHWRNQPYKDPETGERATRLVWIHPYLKGPEDKPLLVRDHVYNLVR